MSKYALSECNFLEIRLTEVGAQTHETEVITVETDMVNFFIYPNKNWCKLINANSNLISKARGVNVLLFIHVTYTRFFCLFWLNGNFDPYFRMIYTLPYTHSPYLVAGASNHRNKCIAFKIYQWVKVKIIAQIITDWLKSLDKIGTRMFLSGPILIHKILNPISFLVQWNWTPHRPIHLLEQWEQWTAIQRANLCDNCQRNFVQLKWILLIEF